MENDQNHGYKTQSKLWKKIAASCRGLYPPLRGIVQLTNSVASQKTFRLLRFRNWSFTNKLAYQCKIFSVYEEKVALPDGRSVKQSWIDHKPTVAIVAVNNEKKVLMIKQYRTAVKIQLLEIPAGTIDGEGEHPVICAQRELAEETGFKAKTLIKLFEGYLVPGYCNEYMHFFLATDLYYEPLSADDDEFIEVFPMSFAEAKELLKNGEIIDAKTALCLILAENYLDHPAFT